MAADGQIRVIVSAGLDRSVQATFDQIPKIAERTAKQVAKAMGGATAGSGGPGDALAKSFGQAAKASRSASSQIDKDWKDRLKALNAYAKEQDKIAARTANEEIKQAERASKEKERLLAKETRDKEREAARQTREAGREIDRQISQQDRARDRFASRTSQRAVRFMFPNPIGAFGMASRIGGDLMRGAGVDMSIAGSVGRAVDTQALATQLSSQGYMKGQAGPNGQRVSAATLEAEARANAASVAGDPQQMLRAQTKFVDITGNLADARVAMPGIGKLSVATGTDPEKMAEAWANVSRHMGDIPDKAAKVEGLMRLIAGQGRVGSIEIKDEAKDLGKIAAMADKYGGDRATTIGKLATLAQLGKAEGGSASSAQAATSIVSFTNTFASGARLKAMFAAGLKESDIFQMQGTGKNAVRAHIQDPFEIIKKVLQKTGGDITKFGSVFKSVMSQRATNALTAAYNSGGGHNMAAVNSKIAEFGQEATLTPDQVKENVAEYKGTDKAKAQEFQNALDGIISQSKNELAPALTALQGPALQAATALSWLVKEAAAHPIEAAGIAVAGALGRALLESGFRAVVEKSITNAMANGNGLQIGGAGLMITIAAATVVMHLIDEDIKDREDKQRQAALNNANAGGLEGEAAANARKGIYTAKGKGDLEAIDANLEGRIKRAATIGDLDRANGGAPTSALGIAKENLLAPERGAARQDAAHLDALRAELAENKRVLDMIRTGTLRVSVVNASEIAGMSGPHVFAPGREHATGELPAYLRR